MKFFLLNLLMIISLHTFSQDINEMLKLSTTMKSSSFIYNPEYFINKLDHPNVKYFNFFYRDSIVCKISYEDARNTCITCYYVMNKQKAIEKHYYKGNPQGLDVSYYKNGTMFSFTYVDSLIEYPLILLNKDGNFSDVSTISEKKNSGKELSFNGHGDIWQRIECIDSTKSARIFTEYTNCGDTMYQCIIRKGKQPITFYLTSTSEKICEGYIYNSYELYVGKWKSWYHNGQLKQEYEFDDNSRTLSKPIGHWLYYSENGKIIKEEIYEDGELIKMIKH